MSKFKKLFKQIKQYSRSSSGRRKYHYSRSGSSSRRKNNYPYSGSHRYKRKGYRSSS